MFIKKFVLEYLNSNMFMIIENNKAILIDPNISKEAFNILKENKIEQVLIILTHSHYDHTSGVVWFYERFNCKIIAQKYCSQLIKTYKNNRPFLMCIVLNNLDINDNGNRMNEFLAFYKPYTISTDISIESVYEFKWEKHSVLIKHTPGHSLGSICIFIDDCVFSGDYLIKGESVLISKNGGSEVDYIKTTLPILREIKLGTIVYPGHGNVYKFNKFALNLLNLNRINRR